MTLCLLISNESSSIRGGMIYDASLSYAHLQVDFTEVHRHVTTRLAELLANIYNLNRGTGHSFSLGV